MCSQGGNNKTLKRLFFGGARKVATAVSAGQYKTVLMDGERLADLMIEHGLGVSVAVTCHLKRMDSGFFSRD